MASRPRAKANDKGRTRRSQSPKRGPCDDAGARRCGAKASSLLLDAEVFGFVLGARTGRGRAGGLVDTDRTRAGITRSVWACCLELPKRERNGLAVGRLAATFVGPGWELVGAGTTSEPGRLGSVFGTTGASAGAVVGATTFVGAGVVGPPGVLGDGASGSEIGTTASSEPSQSIDVGV
jgi:hypothetical protein